VGKLCTREKYLRTERNAHELLWDISVFLLGEFKSLKKGLVNLSFLTEIIKEEDRGEKKFRAFRTGSCPFFPIILSATNLSIFSSLIF
jgi:hypothetical protein